MFTSVFTAVPLITNIAKKKNPWMFDNWRVVKRMIVCSCDVILGSHSNCAWESICLLSRDQMWSFVFKQWKTQYAVGECHPPPTPATHTPAYALLAQEPVNNGSLCVMQLYGIIYLPLYFLLHFMYLFSKFL